MEVLVTIFIANALKPIVFSALCYCILFPARRAVERHMQDGRLKRFLLFRISKED